MAADPYRYFRPEARELVDGMQRGVLELERGAAGKATIAELLRYAHTLKGAARVVRQPGLAELAHAIEELLSPRRDGSAVPKAEVDELLRLCDAINEGVNAIDTPEAAEPVAAPAQRTHADEPLETVRIEIAEMDTLLQGISEAGVQLHGLGRKHAELERSRGLAHELVQELRGDARLSLLAEQLSGALDQAQKDLDAGSEQVERELIQVRDTADRMRLLPASVLFGTLERAVRDAGQLVRRRVEFRASGGAERADANVLSKLGVALLHVVRNAVAHGIEAERAGKPPVGVVELSVEQRGNRLTFSCRDDGRGIDVSAVRKVAVQRGLISEAEAAGAGIDRVVELLLSGGVSTTPVATQTSGRGVGLDVVRAVAVELKGEVKIDSVPGRGTTVKLLVPVTLSSVNALRVEASGVTVSLPMQAVARVVAVPPSGVARSGGRESIVHDGQAIPFVALWQALGRPRGDDWKRVGCAVILRWEERLTAVGVDRLLGAAEVVVRPLPSLAAAEPIVAGASFDTQGNPCLLLDPGELARAARKERAAPVEAAPTTRAPVLIVDDSLTTRMLEQSILESAGYDVELATSAEEALEKVRDRRYSLFLVDVEMPGMSGFDFVARMRADPELRETPAMLVTSRGAPEDRRRGMEAGARAYIVKGDFDQGRLLDTIAGLIGR